MGIDTTTYIGAYVTVKNKTVISTYKKTIYINDLTGKEFEKAIKFDPHTGDPVSKKEIDVDIEKSVSGWYGMMDELGYPENLDEDAFFEPAYSDISQGYGLLLPNSGKSLTSIDSGRGESALQEISKDDPEKFTKALQERYEEELKSLKSFYEEVEVKFGVVVYSH